MAAVAGVQLEHLAGVGLDARAHVAVRVHRPLGPARGARRVDQVGEVLGVHGDHARLAAGVECPGGQRGGGSGRLEAVGHDGRGLAVVDQVREPRRVGGGIDRHRHRADARRAEERLEPPAPVAERHDHPVTPAHARLPQRPAGPRRRARELLVGPRSRLVDHRVLRVEPGLRLALHEQRHQVVAARGAGGDPPPLRGGGGCGRLEGRLGERLEGLRRHARGQHPDDVGDAGVARRPRSARAARRGPPPARWCASSGCRRPAWCRACEPPRRPRPRPRPASRPAGRRCRGRTTGAAARRRDGPPRRSRGGAPPPRARGRRPRCRRRARRPGAAAAAGARPPRSAGRRGVPAAGCWAAPHRARPPDRPRP